MSIRIEMKVDSLLSRVNQILMRKYDYPEDQAAEIEAAISTWNQLPFVRYYEEGLCKKEELPLKTFNEFLLVRDNRARGR